MSLAELMPSIDELTASLPPTLVLLNTLEVAVVEAMVELVTDPPEIVESGTHESVWLLVAALATIGGDMNEESLCEKYKFDLPENLKLDSGDGSTKIKVLAGGGQLRCIVVGDLIYFIFRNYKGVLREIRNDLLISNK